MFSCLRGSFGEVHGSLAQNGQVVGTQQTWAELNLWSCQVVGVKGPSADVEEELFTKE